MGCTLSVIIPNRNGAATICHCLDAVFASSHDSFEVIVVDDCSDDNSVEIIQQYPCRLLEFSSHRGAAAARNAGAEAAQGDVLFFTDADCVILPDTLSQVEKSCTTKDTNVIIGGTYTCKPYDIGFFSLFQSVFVHHSEVKNKERPDYIATHAMALSRSTFRISGGFSEDFFLPIVEDVEYSHRLLDQGFQLLIDPDLQVRHIFNFSFAGSVTNAFRKSKHWTIYSLGNKDLCKDSGCASFELKVNVFALFAALLLLFVQSVNTETFSPFLATLPFVFNLIVSRRLLQRYYTTFGIKTALTASLYYTLVYAAAVGFGGLAGAYSYFAKPPKRMVISRALLGQSDKQPGL